MDRQDFDNCCQLLRKRELEQLLDAALGLSELGDQLANGETAPSVNTVKVGHAIMALSSHIQNVANQIDDALSDMRSLTRQSY